MGLILLFLFVFLLLLLLLLCIDASLANNEPAIYAAIEM